MSSLISADQTLTVGELAQMLRWTLDEAFGSGVWVAGEIDSITRARSGHVYFDLVERSERAEPGAPPVASVSVVLFRDDKDRVNTVIKRHGNAIRMDDGVSVRIQGMLDFYAPRGQLQLRMIAIDPAHTLGALAAEREALLKALAAEGILSRNAGVALAPVPLRVGLVTSAGSAAHADMLKVFATSGFAFKVFEIDTRVQGPDAPAEIAAAIGAAAGATVDVVVLARGGGSRTDLVAFDHELVARAIAMCERPVFTGIGHEIDRS
ncbi:MAG: exodeoxyribonuclease VII large subunit, partial [Acidimicrobiaceae bacterium]|nr:exodeoxyribonuclease VII large subunit [Acidimicrobiaceae bacterium]